MLFPCPVLLVLRSLGNPVQQEHIKVIPANSEWQITFASSLVSTSFQILFHEPLKLMKMSWIKLPSHFQKVLGRSLHAPACSGTLRVTPKAITYLCCYLSLLLIFLIFLSILAPKSTHDLTSSGCSGCCALSHHSQICGSTIISLFYFILVANNSLIVLIYFT